MGVCGGWYYSDIVSGITLPCGERGYPRCRKLRNGDVQKLSSVSRWWRNVGLMTGTIRHRRSPSPPPSAVRYRQSTPPPPNAIPIALYLLLILIISYTLLSFSRTRNILFIHSFYNFIIFYYILFYILLYIYFIL